MAKILVYKFIITKKVPLIRLQYAFFCTFLIYTLSKLFLTATERMYCMQNDHKIKVQYEGTITCLWLDSVVVICIIGNW